MCLKQLTAHVLLRNLEVPNTARKQATMHENNPSITCCNTTHPMHEHKPAFTSSLEEIQAPKPDNETSRVQITQLSQVLELSTPQAAHRRPTADGILSLLCEHCGGMVPRSGATTVYGTPFITPTASGWNSETSSIFSVSGNNYQSTRSMGKN